MQNCLKSYFLVAIFLFTNSFFAQNLYDDDLLPPEFHASRRQALRNKMEENSMAIVFSNPERNRSNDVDFQYHQSSDFYYLTGCLEPNAVLLIFKNAIDGLDTDEIIYVQPRDKKSESWTGKRIGTEGATGILGIKSAFNNYQFHDLSLDFSKFNKIYHPHFYNDYRDDETDSGDLYSLIKSFNEKTKKYQDKKNSSHFHAMMAGLREIKTPEEMKLLSKAIKITCDAHLDLMKSLEPNMTEYKAQALIEFGFKFNGSEYVGYPSIVGNAENTCILHYITNRRKFENNSLLVVDAGAEYHGYTADVTRTLPINGKFSDEQKKIYDLVLKAQEAGINVCKKGNNFRDPHNAAVDVIKKGLMELKIIEQPNDFQEYFFHGTSHYLGLDVHDAGTYGKLKPNSVITVEPGIYISEGSPCDKKWWNIGVRIEDDILITDSEPINLSGNLPKKTEEIEKVMKEVGILNKN
jgi:Xaa-Pro aminopeptidase